MNSLYRLAILVQLAAAAGLAQSQAHEYVGDIVNANCFQAQKIVNRNSRGELALANRNAFTRSSEKAVPNSPSVRRKILRHCAINPGTTSFAIVSDDGNFFKLDEAGNRDVLSQISTSTKRLKARVTGSVDRDALVVKSLSKF
jgi:hypothetical protein